QRPPMRERHDRACSPILVINRRTVFGGNRAHVHVSGMTHHRFNIVAGGLRAKATPVRGKASSISISARFHRTSGARGSENTLDDGEILETGCGEPDECAEQPG